MMYEIEAIAQRLADAINEANHEPNITFLKKVIAKELECMQQEGILTIESDDPEYT